MDSITKKCTRCKVEKPLDAFGKERRNKDAKKSWCRECSSQYSKDYRAAHPEEMAAKKMRYLDNGGREKVRKQYYENGGKERQSAWRREQKYGITQEQFDGMVLAQNGRCAICKKAPKVFSIDHCHSNGQVRGLLCNKCNVAIGLLNDDTEVIASAARYLITNEKRLF